MKKVFIVLSLVLLLGTGCSFKDLFIKENEQVDLLSGKVNVEMVIKDYGTIKLELDADTAPITVTNFVNLVNDEFYNGLTIHRAQKDFVIQGGDPNHDGSGGSSKTIKGEFASNGVENNISHVRGVISMARSNDPNSATSQFFIVQKDAKESLDGNYAGFGHVTEGMEVVDKIMNSVTPIDNMGSIDYKEQPVIESIKVIE